MPTSRNHLSGAHTNMKIALAILAVSLAFSGYAIHQKVTPIADSAVGEVCLIKNLEVREGFVAAYSQSLQTRGYEVRSLPSTASVLDCPMTSTYTAHWRWDMALYMAYAEIKVYKKGRITGQATYNALGGGANMGKFISAEAKIEEMVSELFPKSITK